VQRRARPEANAAAWFSFLLGRVRRAVAPRREPLKVFGIEPERDAAVMPLAIGIGRFGLAGHVRSIGLMAFPSIDSSGTFPNAGPGSDLRVSCRFLLRKMLVDVINVACENRQPCGLDAPR
jgi:hypothetical protein